MLDYFPFNFYSVERSNKNLRMLYEKFDKDNNEAWVTPDLGRNVVEILPHSTPFLNDRSEFLDIPSTMDRGTGNQIYTNIWINGCISDVQLKKKKSVSCFDIWEFPISPEKWNWNRLIFLPFIFIFEQWGLWFLHLWLLSPTRQECKSINFYIIL